MAETSSLYEFEPKFARMHKQEMSISDNIDAEVTSQKNGEENLESLYESLSIDQRLDHPDWRVRAD